METQHFVLSGRDQALEFAGYGFRAHHPLFQSIPEKSAGGNQTSSGMCHDVHRESELIKITVTSSGRAPDVYRTSSINLRGTCEPSALRQIAMIRSDPVYFGSPSVANRRESLSIPLYSKGQGQALPEPIRGLRLSFGEVYETAFAYDPHTRVTDTRPINRSRRHNGQGTCCFARDSVFADGLINVS
jgi:hypothetical protein